MSKHRSLSLLVAVAAFGLAGPVVAQSRSAVTAAELEAAVTARPADRDAGRGVRVTSDQIAPIPAQASSRAEIADSRSEPRRDRPLGEDRVLAGGADKIVISTTAVIIGLLLIILLVD